MMSKEIIREIMERSGIGMVQMAKALGFKYPQKITNRLYTKGNSLRADVLDEMARAAGYKVLVVPKDVELREGWYEIDDSKNEAVGDDTKESE